MFPSKSPDITLVFSGLFLFAFEEENKSCQLAVVQAERHCLKIGIKAKSDSPIDAPEFSFKVPNGDIFFEIPGRAQGVDTYEPGPFERYSQHDRRDFRWLFDFEGREFHHRRLRLRADALKRSVFVYNGLFYTCSSQEVIIKRPPSTSHPAAGKIDGASHVPQSQNALIAKSIGCDIYLDDREEFQLISRAGCSISLKKDPKINYEISVTNLCAHDVEQESAGSSDFALYYDIINVPEDQQFEILPVPILPAPNFFAPGPPTANDLLPCNPAGVLTSKSPLRAES